METTQGQRSTQNTHRTIVILISFLTHRIQGHSNLQAHSHTRHVDHHRHNRHHHRRRTSLSSDFSATRPSVFDSCLLPCYADIVDRYGAEFAEHLREDGFVYETCLGDDGNSTVADDGRSGDAAPSPRRGPDRILGATDDPSKLWTGRGSDGKLEVPYRIKPTSAFAAETLDAIRAALGHIEEETGVIRFVERADEVEYIYFSYETWYDNICASNLGRQSLTSTKIYLGWCRSMKHKGNIVHEILHALGFWHEHSRPDRDDFIGVRWDNVAAGAEDNFRKALEVDSLGSRYDYGSIMHYPSGAYAADPERPTIVNTTVVERWEAIGQRVKLSANDVDQLRLLYQCRSGPRPGPIGIDDLCSRDCPCWERAIGECSSDDECMGDLICDAAPNPFPLPEYRDLMPAFPHASGIVECGEYCHGSCCAFPDNVVGCPETCGTAPAAEVPEVLPSRMCVQDTGTRSGPVVATTSTTGATATTAAATTTSTTTSTSNPAKWYVDWNISKCVQSCVGPAPCGGIGQYVTFHSTVNQCCSAHLSWMSFADCNTMPKNPPPTDRPTPRPTPLPTNAPASRSPTTARPTGAPAAGEPATPVPSSAPSKRPTARPSEAPGGASPSKRPTARPGEAPSAASPSKRPTAPPTEMPNTDSPTRWATPKPSGKPTVNNAQFYIDWNVSKCVQDCIGPAPCGGLKPAWVAGYTSVEICCSTMSWKPFAECSNVPLAPPPTRLPTMKPSNSPSRKPTPGPTSLPTFKSPTAYPVTPPPSHSPSGKPTNKPTNPQPTRTPTTDSPTKQPTNEPTSLPTTGSPSRKPTAKPTPKPTEKPTQGAGDTRWYPGASKCLNDGNAPSWMANLYTSQTTCCSSHFSWDYNNCLGVKQQPSFKWYANWNLGKCVQDCESSQGGSCGGLIPGAYVLAHSSAEACCSAHMSYLSLSQCKY